MYQQLISLYFKIFMNNLHNFHKYANSQNIYRVLSTTRPRFYVQVEDIKLSRKVLYHFANFVIINEILIFENCRKMACSAIFKN